MEKAARDSRLEPSRLQLLLLDGHVNETVIVLGIYLFRQVWWIAGVVSRTGQCGLAPLQCFSVTGQTPDSHSRLICEPIHEACVPFKALFRSSLMPTAQPVFVDGIIHSRAVEFTEPPSQGSPQITSTWRSHPFPFICERYKRREQVRISSHLPPAFQPAHPSSSMTAFYVLGWTTRLPNQPPSQTELFFATAGPCDQFEADQDRLSSISPQIF